MLEIIADNPLLFAGLLIAVVLMLFFSTPKASVKSLRKEIENYNDMLSDYNSLISKYVNIQNKLLDEKMLDNSQLDAINDSAHKFHDLCKVFLSCSDKTDLYLKKRNLVYYRKHKKTADALVNEIAYLYKALEDIYNAAENKNTEYGNSYEQYGNGYGECSQQENNYRHGYNSDGYGGQEYNEAPAAEPENTEKEVFFSGCDTKEKVKQRYRSLVKVYHPDLQNGNTETFRKVQEEYERKMSGFREDEDIKEGNDEI